MLLINENISLINIFLFLIELKNHVYSIRIISETNSIDPLLSNNSCYLISDCFNCTLIPTCRWSWEVQYCFPFNLSNNNYSISLLSQNNNLGELNSYINFIRKSCFKPINLYMKNDNYFSYDNISLKYCGEHYIISNEYNIRNNFKLEINNVEGSYGTPHLLCEFVFLSVPNFHANIKINQEEIKYFYLLYSEDSLNFIQNINSSRSIYITSSPNKLHTFAFYCLKSLNKSPFSITYEQDIIEKANEALGYIMVSLSCIMIIIIVIVIVYIRKKSVMFKNEEKKIQLDENEKLKKHYAKQNSEEIKLKENIKIEKSLKYTYNFTPPTNTPTHLLNRQQFRFDTCCVDGKVIEKSMDIKMADCGHFYHINCFNKLIQDMHYLNEKDLKCFSCKKVIYP